MIKRKCKLCKKEHKYFITTVKHKGYWDGCECCGEDYVKPRIEKIITWYKKDKKEKLIHLLNELNLKIKTTEKIIKKSKEDSLIISKQKNKGLIPIYVDSRIVDAHFLNKYTFQKVLLISEIKKLK